MRGFAPADELVAWRVPKGATFAVEQKTQNHFRPVAISSPQNRITWLRNSLRSNSARQIVEFGTATPPRPTRERYLRNKSNFQSWGGVGQTLLNTILMPDLNCTHVRRNFRERFQVSTRALLYTIPRPQFRTPISAYAFSMKLRKSSDCDRKNLRKLKFFRLSVSQILNSTRYS